MGLSSGGGSVVTNSTSKDDVNESPDQRLQVSLFTDGACLGNPGPGGWAFILRDGDLGDQRVESGGEHGTTNNRMEIIAVIRGLEALPRPARVELYSDS